MTYFKQMHKQDLKTLKIFSQGLGREKRACQSRMTCSGRRANWNRANCKDTFFAPLAQSPFMTVNWR